MSTNVIARNMIDRSFLLGNSSYLRLGSVPSSYYSYISYYSPSLIGSVLISLSLSRS
jgi:hypothetical protein